MAGNIVFTNNLGKGFDINPDDQKVHAKPVSTDTDNALTAGADGQAWISHWTLGYESQGEYDSADAAFSFNDSPEKPFSYSVTVNPNNNPTNGPVTPTAATGYTLRWNPMIGTTDGTLEVVVTESGVSRTFIRNRTADAWGAWQETSSNYVWLNRATEKPATTSTESIHHAGNVQVDGALASKAVTNTTAGTLNDVDVSGTSVLRFTAGQTITGFAGAVNEQYLTVINASGTLSLTIADDSTSSAAGARVETGIDADLVLAPKAAALLIYDSTAQRWRNASTVNLGYVSSFAQVAANAVQGLNAPNNFTFNVIAASSGSDISLVGGGIRLKGGKTYKLQGVVPWTNPNAYCTFQWYDGANLVGQAGHNEAATSGSAVGSTGVVEAVVSPTVDTTYWIRVTSAGGAVYTTAGRYPYAFAEVISGREPATNIRLYSKVYTGLQADPNVTSPGEAVEGYTYLQTTDGTKTGTPRNEWRYDGVVWVRVNPVESTFYGLPNPNSTAPTVMPMAGDKYLLTSDGTSTGLVQSVWEYTGTTWIQIGGFPTSVAVPAGAIRTYFPSYTALQHKFPSAMTTAPASYGFTAVGGAAITNWGSYGTPAYRMFQLTATRPTCTASANTLYSVPTSYVRHEVAVNPDTANQYMLQVLSDGTREVAAEVWLCDPVTGVPAKRLYANMANESGSSDGADRFSVSRAPDNASGYQDGFRLWVGWEIPKSLIDTYKTATNTIKLAIRPGADNGEGNIFYICGYAAVESKYAVVHLPALVFENTANIAANRNATTGGNQLTWWGDYAGCGQCYVPNAQNRVLDIPLTDTSKDIYLTTSGLQRDGTDSSGHGISEADFSIVHASGDVALGRPRLDIQAPCTGICDWGHRPMGFLIPAAVLAAKATALHANSAVQYLRVRIAQPAGLNGHIHFILTEQVS